ncbi:DUF3500 domain-containing protein [Spirosoma pollinicola]|uniref:DUF3500 domain-containing protein n=1 Tax=Spirosoma pollinicola TaxID=2057025 RepID=A0A2K8Z7D8_9BACT|nr:DUF3500 domain-containing protein [Spirosoma pollinicola]AUD05807.1 hypothetical protein CWM47_30555 [Spirosoma pollinicola]
MKFFTFYGIGLCILSALLVDQQQTHTPSVSPVFNSLSTQSNADCASVKGLEKIVCLADAFNATLTSEQRAMLQLTYSKADATKWSNFPEFSARPRRVGIQLGTLNAAQLTAAKALMAAVMAQNVPNEGFDELEGNLAADDYFGKTTGKTGTFSSGNYYMAFLGTPSTTGLWELQFGGHHYAFANTYNGGNVAGVTPSFRGVEPMSAVTVNGHTYQPVAQEQQAFGTMLGSLSSNEQAAARLSSSFSDVVLGPDRDGQFPSKKLGLKVGDLPAARQKLVLNAIKLYVNDLDPATAAPVLANYTAELADTYIAYAGSGSMSQQNDYVRIDGPGVWIEYSAQPSRDFPGTVHPHSVWRDHRTDYGGN